MSAFVLKAKEQVILYWIAIVMFLLFTVNALALAIISGLIGSDWNSMDGQGKFMLFLAVLANWTNTMFAFFNKTVGKVKKGELPFDDDGSGNTQTFTKTAQVTTQTAVQTKSTP